ncbi:proteasome endopeptidase complex, beta subunit [Violaceomyces palustris]|uniref:Proteasome endopeptidase complex, beta subunit n=1 Tax=Violaceomyces palustris TaxID=1673888 RepID=A0ACD0P4F9_9BASI|nr:proteasome endopeptidase complex, beta subunit [Violaceomyces palustris]
MNYLPGQTWSSQPAQHHHQFASASYNTDPSAHTSQPIVTGTSVIAIRFKDGVMMATDTLASYGSLARFMDIKRIEKVGENTILGASGDMSDWQYVQHTLDKLMLREQNENDGHILSPSQIYAYLARVMYNRRSKMDPIWNSFVLAGVDPKDGSPFLGYVDLLGTTYSASTIATGFGLHLAQPLLRKAVEGREDQIEEEEAKRILEECMKVLFYRDARSLNRFVIATVTKEGSKISEPYSVPTSWGFAEMLRGYGPQTQ